MGQISGVVNWSAGSGRTWSTLVSGSVNGSMWFGSSFGEVNIFCPTLSTKSAQPVNSVDPVNSVSSLDVSA
ncbi:hypothetical protein Hanom_Chr04g00343021 [Helianthus anomalus]